VLDKTGIVSTENNRSIKMKKIWIVALLMTIAGISMAATATNNVDTVFDVKITGQVINEDSGKVEKGGTSGWLFNDVLIYAEKGDVVVADMTYADYSVEITANEKAAKGLVAFSNMTIAEAALDGGDITVEITAGVVMGSYSENLIKETVAASLKGVAVGTINDAPATFNVQLRANSKLSGKTLEEVINYIAQKQKLSEEQKAELVSVFVDEE